MIKLINLSKSFGKQIIFKNLNLTFPDCGFVSVLGPSGCGKSTLLNIIGGLITDYNGKVIINNYSLSNMTQANLAQFRANKIGFVFQNHNLFRFDTVLQNTKLPLLMENKHSNEFINRQATFNLNRVSVFKMTDKSAMNLSGGEKQRVAIARALIKNPCILLCDEPTASLDFKTGEGIFKLLKDQAKNRLVIVVTHNQELARKYSDGLVEFDKDQIIKTRVSDLKSKVVESKIVTKTRIPYFFFVRAAIKRLMVKKWRFMICNLISTLGFLALGLALLFSSSLSHSLNQSVNNFVGNNYIVASKKTNNLQTNTPVYLTRLELESFKNELLEYDFKVGASYQNNLNALMKHENKFVILTNDKPLLLASLGVESINQFVRCDDYSSIYPLIQQPLKQDEVILGLSKADLLLINQQLNITPATIEKLGEYIAMNKSQLKFSVKNSDWEYSDEQILTIKGVKETEVTSLIHPDAFWNEWMIEECMRFKTLEDQVEVFPWSLDKKYYLETNVKNFIELSLDEPYFDSIHFIRTKEHESRYYAISKDAKAFNLSEVKRILKTESNLDSYIFSSSKSYYVANDTIGAGFASDFLLSSSEAMLDDAIEQNSELKLGTLVTYPSEIVLGNIINLNSRNLKFSSDLSNLTHGEVVSTPNEIIVSSSLAKQLFKSEELAVGKTLNVAYLQSLATSKDEVLRTYQKSTLYISGVKTSNQNLIYQKPTWTIIYFNDYLGVDALSNTIEAVAFTLKDDLQTSENLKALKKAYPNIKFACPTFDIKTSIDDTMMYVQYTFGLFSIMAIIIAVILISFTIYLYVLENKQDSKIIIALGGGTKDVKTMFKVQIYVIILCSTFSSILSLLIVALSLNKTLSTILPISLTLTYAPFLSILGVGMFVSLVVGRIALFNCEYSLNG